jgi:hypothetical protein
MNIIRRIDEQARSYTGWLDATISEPHANSFRRGFYFGALIAVINEIAKAFFECSLPFFAFPFTFVSVVVTGLFVGVTVFFLNSVLDRPLISFSQQEEALAQRIKAQSA